MGNIEKVHGPDTIRFISRSIIATAIEPKSESEEMGAERVMRRSLQ